MLVGMVVLTVGLAAMAQLLTVTIVMHAGAREATTSVQHAQSKIDELLRLPLATAPAVQVTPTSPDSLSNNVTNYFDTPAPGITRRWRVQAGPAANTRTLTIRIINSRARHYGARLDLTTVIRQW